MFTKIFLALTLSTQIFALRLEKASTFKANFIEGVAHVTCFSPQGTSTATFRCSESYLNPSNFSRVISDENVDADKVTLTYKDGNKTRTKSSKFSGNKSKSEFNLWIWSLTQRPLLNLGENEISYELSKGKTQVEAGVFTVNVEPTPTRYCATRSYTSSFADDCTNGTNVCNQFFREQNFCR